MISCSYININLIYLHCTYTSWLKTFSAAPYQILDSNCLSLYFSCTIFGHFIHNKLIYSEFLFWILSKCVLYDPASVLLSQIWTCHICWICQGPTCQCGLVSLTQSYADFAQAEKDGMSSRRNLVAAHMVCPALFSRKSFWGLGWIERAY